MGPDFGITVLILGFGFLLASPFGRHPDCRTGSFRQGTKGPAFKPLGYCMIGLGLLLIFVGRLAMGTEPGLREIFLVVYPTVVAGWFFFFWFRSRNRKLASRP